MKDNGALAMLTALLILGSGMADVLTAPIGYQQQQHHDRSLQTNLITNFGVTSTSSVTAGGAGTTTPATTSSSSAGTGTSTTTTTNLRPSTSTSYCLRCPYNAVALVDCVTTTADPDQCRCNEGLEPNGRGGCLASTSTATGTSPYFRRRSPCISCSWYAWPLVACVTDASDPAQCQCRTEYQANDWGGCSRIYPDTNVASASIVEDGSTTAAAQESTEDNSTSPPTMTTGTSPPIMTSSTPPPITTAITSGTTRAKTTTEINVGFVGGSYAPCPTGFFRTSPEVNAPCMPCLSCSWNSFPLVECVTQRTDPLQCQCQEGYFSNMRGGCLPNGSNTMSETDRTLLLPCNVGECRSPTTKLCAPRVTCYEGTKRMTSCVTDPNDPLQCAGATGGTGGTTTTGGTTGVTTSGTTIDTTGGTTGGMTGGTTGGTTGETTGGTTGGTTGTTTEDNSTSPPTMTTGTSPPIMTSGTPPPMTTAIPSGTTGTTTTNPNTLVINVGPIDGSFAPCPTGTFRTSPEVNAPCMPCLSCSWNSFPLVECVTQRTNPLQCQCQEGYFSNNRGGCLPNGTDTVSETDRTLLLPCSIGQCRSPTTKVCAPRVSCAPDTKRMSSCVTDPNDPAQCGPFTPIAQVVKESVMTSSANSNSKSSSTDVVLGLSVVGMALWQLYRI